MIEFDILDRHTSIEDLGLLPEFLSSFDPSPAREQLDRNYQHGGGWRSFTSGWVVSDDMTISYPGDEPLSPLAVAHLRNESIYVYPHSWVLIKQPDGSFDIARMD